MVTNAELKPIMEKISNLEQECETHKWWINISKNMFVAGALFLSYAGTKAIFGANLEEIGNRISNHILGKADIYERIENLIGGIGITLESMGVFGFLEGHWHLRSYKKQIKQEQKKLELLEKDYDYSRGYN